MGKIMKAGKLLGRFGEVFVNGEGFGEGFENGEGFGEAFGYD